MEKNIEKQEFEFSLVSFLRIFKGKLKMLIAIGLVSAIIGGTAGVLVSLLGKKTYGNLLAFYFPTPEITGYSTVIPLLESDLFTENVLIGTKVVEITDADGEKVDVKIPDLKYSAEEEADVLKYEAAKLKLTESIKNYKNRLKALPLEIDNLKSQLTAANSAYTPFKDEYNRLWTVYSEGLSSTAYEKITALENSDEYKAAKSNYNNAQTAYDEKVIEQAKVSETLFNAEKELAEVTEKSNGIINALRTEWRRDPANKELVDDFHDNVTYSFTKDGSPLTLNTQTKEDTSGKFIYIDIRIPENQALADKVIDNITNDIAEFVISNTTPVEKNDQIECMRISSGDAKDVNEDSLIKNTAIYAIIAFFAVEIITGLVIICAYLKNVVFAESSAKALADGEDTSDKSKEE